MNNNEARTDGLNPAAHEARSGRVLKRVAAGTAAAALVLLGPTIKNTLEPNDRPVATAEAKSGDYEAAFSDKIDELLTTYDVLNGELISKHNREETYLREVNNTRVIAHRAYDNAPVDNVFVTFEHEGSTVQVEYQNPDNNGFDAPARVHIDQIDKVGERQEVLDLGGSDGYSQDRVDQGLSLLTEVIAQAPTTQNVSPIGSMLTD